MFRHETIASHFLYILEIDPCGENSPLMIQTSGSGLINSSMLRTDYGIPLNCAWLIKVERYKTLMIKGLDIKMNNRWGN